MALNIQKATARIHASYLFEHVGKPALQKLCLLLSSTATGKIYSGWQEFAAYMGLTMEQIRVRACTQNIKFVIKNIKLIYTFVISFYFL